MSLPKGFSKKHDNAIPQGTVDGIGKCCKTDKKLWIGIGISLAVLSPIITAVLGLWIVFDWLQFLWALFISAISIGFIFVLSLLCWYTVKEYCKGVKGEKHDEDIGLAWGFVGGVSAVIVIIVLVSFWNYLWQGAF
jgi:hypothetical protein